MDKPIIYLKLHEIVLWADEDHKQETIEIYVNLDKVSSFKRQKDILFDREYTVVCYDGIFRTAVVETPEKIIEQIEKLMKVF